MRILFSLLPALFVWLALEAIALVASWHRPDWISEGWRSFYEPHPHRAYALVPGRVRQYAKASTNPQGLRGRPFSPHKAPSTVRMVCMGGSTTYSDGATTDGRTYPAQLERYLREHYAGAAFAVEVLNAGVDAYDSLQVLSYFETRILDFDPDVLLVQTGVNDALLMAATREFESDFGHARSLFAPPPVFWWEHSPLLSLLMRRRTSPTNRFWPNDSLGMLPFIYKPGVIGWPNPWEAEERLFSDRLDVQARNVRSLIAVARGNGVVPILLTMGYEVGRWPYGPFVARLNERLREIAGGEQVHLVDLAREMPWNATAYYDTCHLRDNREGLARKAEVVAASLIGERVVDQIAGRRARDTRHRGQE
jgi:hypothetical protein